MTDDSEMPFGKHKGEKLGDVPASYLLWLWDSGAYQPSHRLHSYIKESLSALETECPDYIIKHPIK